MNYFFRMILLLCSITVIVGGLYINDIKAEPYFFDNFSSGKIDQSNWTNLFQPNEGSIVSIDGKKAFKSEMHYLTNYKGLAGDVPRSEIQLTTWSKNRHDLEIGKEYVISVKSKVPSDEQIETHYNQYLLFQVHQYSGTASPVFGLYVDKNHYFVQNCTPKADGTYRYYVSPSLGNISDLLGVWVNWTLRIKVSDKNDGLLQLYKNGKEVCKFSGPTAYPHSNNYFVIGLYKWNWQRFPTSTNYHYAYFTDFNIQKY